MLEVRKVTRADLPDVVKLGLQESTEANYTFPKPNPAKALAHYAASMVNGDGVVVLNDGEVVGAFLWTRTQPNYSDEWYAYVFFSYLRPEHRNSTAGLTGYRLFKRWARQQGLRMAAEHQLGDDNMDRLDRFFHRLGMKRIGATYIEA